MSIGLGLDPGTHPENSALGSSPRTMPKESIVGITPLAVIVHDLDLVGVSVVPDEAHTPLIVDPHAVLPPSLARERLETIARWCPQIAQRTALCSCKSFLLPIRSTSCGTPLMKPRSQAARAASFLNDLIIRPGY
jgi:hypothetical protein